MTKKGIETHRWGYYIKLDQKLLATCRAKTLYEAQNYFEEVDLTSSGSEICDTNGASLIEVKIIPEDLFTNDLFKGINLQQK